MSLVSNTIQGKWLTDPLAHIQSILQAVLLVLIAGCLGIAWWRYQNTVFVISEAKSGAKGSAAENGDPAVKSIQPLSFYTDLTDKRDIFSFAGSSPSAEGAAVEVISPVSQDMMSRYIVQGIVHDGDPMAIIKDKQSNKTYFLHRSDILEGASLVDIRDNHVIFNRGGEMMELIKK